MHAQMLFNSGPLLAVIIIDMVALLMYNFSGMCVTGEHASSAYAVPVKTTRQPLRTCTPHMLLLSPGSIEGGQSMLFGLWPFLRGLPANHLLACAGGLGAVFSTVLETMRTLCVWMVDLMLFYIAPGMGRLFPELSL